MSKVSVIVPVYNVENYIEKMLESVQAQTFKDFEVILVNDGSTDRSQEIIDVFCNSDKRFKSFYQENGGVASARNKGIELASSDYIVFYDPDDYIPKKALKKMYKVASGKKADMVVGIMEEKSLGEYFDISYGDIFNLVIYTGIISSVLRFLQEILKKQID